MDYVPTVRDTTQNPLHAWCVCDKMRRLRPSFFIVLLFRIVISWTGHVNEWRIRVWFLQRNLDKDSPVWGERGFFCIAFLRISTMFKKVYHISLGMIVLSLFDWISCARVALDRASIFVDHYYASEVDKYAIQVSQKNRPDIVQLGDVSGVNFTKPLDLLIGWSPCQDLSIAKKDRKWLDGERSWLFREYVRILKESNPRWFILENVASMPKEAKAIITAELWVEPIMIDASLVSAQSRKRLFWTNIPWVTQPEDKGILLKDILIDWIAEREKSLVITATYSSACPQDYFGKSNRQLIKVWHFNKWGQGDRVYSVNWKSVTLSALWGWRWAKTWLYYIEPLWIYRKLHTIECERLQWLHDNYTAWISNSQRYKCLWNAFNVDVVAHILSFIK